MRTPRAPELQESRGERVSEGRHTTYAHAPTDSAGDALHDTPARRFDRRGFSRPPEWLPRRRHSRTQDRPGSLPCGGGRTSGQQLDVLDDALRRAASWSLDRPLHWAGTAHARCTDSATAHASTGQERPTRRCADR